MGLKLALLFINHILLTYKAMLYYENKLPGSFNVGKYLGQQRNCWIPTEDFAPWSLLNLMEFGRYFGLIKGGRLRFVSSGGLYY
jgi:hypothetical protein